MSEVVQIVFLGHWAHLDRLKFLLRKHIPHKVYFVKSEESLGFDPKINDFRQEMKKELEKELPDWVKNVSEEIEMPFFKFEEIFPKMLEVMSKEREKGNEVIVNIHGSSLLMGIATSIAAGLTGSKIYWILPEKWEYTDTDKHAMKPIGAADYFEIKVPLLPSLPAGSEKAVLSHLLKNEGVVKGKLTRIAGDIGLDKLGANLKKPTSGVVKLSRTIGRLRDDSLIETKRIGRKNFEIALTEKGRMMAEVGMFARV